MTEDYYPMPAFAQLEVSDIAESARWYAEILGFRDVFTLPGEDETPQVVHLRRSRFQDLLLIPGGQPDQAGHGVRLYFRFDDDLEALDDLARSVRQADTGDVQGPADMPWNARELTVRDPDGYTLVFTKGPLDAEATMEDIFPGLQ